MTAPSRGRDDATVRGAVVLVVAIVIGLALLWRSGTGDDDATTTTRDAGTTTAALTPSTDASGSTLPTVTTSGAAGPADTQAPALVAVVVFNGTPDRVAGIAREYGDKAATAGYEVLDPADAAATTDTTTIYAAEGFEVDAEAVKGVMELPGAAVAAKPAESLGAGDDLADIVVVLGSDYGG